jgi:hypothetical protein
MKKSLLLTYHLLAGCCDAFTGALLILAPAFTLRLMMLRAPDDALIYISFIGAFVLAVGLAYLYGASIVLHGCCETKLQVLWLITALTRMSVALFVAGQVLISSLPAGWLTVAATDAACVLIQVTGLRKGWLKSANR